MLIEESKRRQAQLLAYLKEMALSCMDETEVREIVIKLKAVYSGGFRHDYSDFFPLIVEFSKEDNSFNLEYLSNNLLFARNLVEKDYVAGELEFKGLYSPLLKLSDHLTLEIGRYNYYSISQQQVSDLEKRNQALQVDLKKATTELETAQKSIHSVQTELISVLSIFAAIVLTFSGSINLLGSALSGMQNAPFFKSAFFVLLCGFIVCNAIFLMMYLVGKITGRSLYAMCGSKDCTCGKDGAPKCGGLTRVRKRLPYVFWLNILIILFMAIDVGVWILDRFFNIIP